MCAFQVFCHTHAHTFILLFRCGWSLGSNGSELRCLARARVLGDRLWFVVNDNSPRANNERCPGDGYGREQHEYHPTRALREDRDQTCDNRRNCVGHLQHSDKNNVCALQDLERLWSQLTTVASYTQRRRTIEQTVIVQNEAFCEKFFLQNYDPLCAQSVFSGFCLGIFL